MSVPPSATWKEGTHPAPGGAVDVVEEVVLKADAPSLLARVDLVSAFQVRAAAAVTQDVVRERRVLHDRPGRGSVLITGATHTGNFAFPRRAAAGGSTCRPRRYRACPRRDLPRARAGGTPPREP